MKAHHAAIGKVALDLYLIRCDRPIARLARLASPLPIPRRMTVLLGKAARHDTLADAIDEILGFTHNARLPLVADQPRA